MILNTIFLLIAIPNVENSQQEKEEEVSGNKSLDKNLNNVKGEKPELSFWKAFTVRI